MSTRLRRVLVLTALLALLLGVTGASANFGHADDPTKTKIGGILLVVGLILTLLGAVGRPIGGRKTFY